MEPLRQTIREKTSSPSSYELFTVVDPLLKPSDDQDNNTVSHCQEPPGIQKLTSIIHENNEKTTNFLTESDRSTKGSCRLRKFSGILYLLIAALLFTSTNFLIKRQNVTILDVILIRSIVQSLMWFGFIIHKGYHLCCSNSHAKLLFMHSVFAAASTVCFYYALQHIPFPDLQTIRYTQVIWTAILAFIIFRERISVPIVIACILTVTGVVCVVRPSFIFRKLENTQETSQKLSMNHGKHVLGMFVALLCALTISIAIILNKKLCDNKVHPSITMFYFVLTTFIMLLVYQTVYWAFLKPADQKFNIKDNYLTKDFLFATILATSQLIPMLLTQKSIKREHSLIISVVQASDILFTIILENIFSAKKSDALALLGSGLVLTSVVIVGAHKLWKDRRGRTSIPPSAQSKQ